MSSHQQTPSASLTSGSQPELTAHEKKASYGQILKSSAMIGGSSLINIAVGIVRTKVMAILLGPAGFGLMGLFGSIADLARSAAGMGVNSSGVRQIAESVGSGDTERIARTVAVLRRVSIILGLLGAVLLIAFCRPVSQMTFGTLEKAGAVALLSLAVLFRLISDGQVALVQGMRRIGDLARISVGGAALGTMISIPLVYFLREDGVVPSLIAIAGMTMVTSWWYGRKVETHGASPSSAEVRKEAAGLLKLGVAFMASAMMAMGSAYVVRIIVLRQIDFTAAGFYQSAWTLGGLYIGFILQAMGADFFPRLTGVVNDHKACNRLVNEQALVSLLMAGPGVIGTLTFAPLVIWLFYSPEFGGAVEVLRWICLGMTLRVITWPMGFIIVAKGRQAIFVITELAYTVVNVGLAWICVQAFGLVGAGVAFFGSYLFHWLIIYPIVRRLTGFRWAATNVKIGLCYIPLIGLVFAGFHLFSFWIATGLGLVISLAVSAYSVRVILTLVPAERIPTPLRSILERLGFMQDESRK